MYGNGCRERETWEQLYVGLMVETLRARYETTERAEEDRHGYAAHSSLFIVGKVAHYTVWLQVDGITEWLEDWETQRL